MRDYELSVLFHPDLEMNLDPAIDKVKKLIEANGGVITKEENEGKKRMNYSIKGQEYAVYYFVDVQFAPEALSKVEGVLNITDEVLRHMVVKVDPRKAKMEARRKARMGDAENSEAEAEAEAKEEK
ncbi:30S ribosomal protein S6 [Candidatus Saccharibacteria bacterium]|nr:30S ribosomal protein S6 [Candidatus Saccharibacteria bacterium]